MFIVIEAKGCCAHVAQISNMKMEREKALEHKQRMSRMMEDKENFLSKIKAARSFIYEVNKVLISIVIYSVNVLQIICFQ